MVDITSNNFLTHLRRVETAMCAQVASGANPSAQPTKTIIFFIFPVITPPWFENHSWIICAGSRWFQPKCAAHERHFFSFNHTNMVQEPFMDYQCSWRTLLTPMWSPPSWRLFLNHTTMVRKSIMNYLRCPRAVWAAVRSTTSKVGRRWSFYQTYWIIPKSFCACPRTFHMDIEKFVY